MKKGLIKLAVIFISLLAIFAYSAPPSFAQTYSSDLYSLEIKALKKADAANSGFTSTSDAYGSYVSQNTSSDGTGAPGADSGAPPDSYLSPAELRLVSTVASSTGLASAAGSWADSGSGYTSYSGSGSTANPDSGVAPSSYLTAAELKAATAATLATTSSSWTGSISSYTPSTGSGSTANPDSGVAPSSYLTAAELKAAAATLATTSSSWTGSESISSPSTAIGYTNNYDSSDYSTSYDSTNYSADSITSSQAVQNYSYQQVSASPDNYTSPSMLGSALELSQSTINQLNSLPANSLLCSSKAADNQGLITQKTDSKNTSTTMSYISAGQKYTFDSSKRELNDSSRIENINTLLANKSNINADVYELLSSNKNKKTDSVNISDFIAKTAESVLSVSFKADKSDQRTDSSDSELLSNILKTDSKNKSNVNLKGTDSIDTVDMVAKNSRVKVDIIHKDTELKEEDLQAAMSGMLPMLRNAILMQAKLMIATHRVNLLLPPLANQPNKNDPIEATARAKVSNSGNGNTKNSNSANAKKYKIRLKKAHILELNIYRNLKCAVNYAKTGLSPPEEDLLPIFLSSGKRILPLFILSKEHRAYVQNPSSSRKFIQNLINNRIIVINGTIYRSCRADLARRGLYSAPPEYGPQIFHITVSGTTVLQPPLGHVAQPVMINHGLQMF
jgi:hypothetical protein